MDEMKKEGHKDLCIAAYEAYKQGKTVIMDTVMYRQEEINFYQATFAKLNVFWVLVYCPLETLVERIIKRNEESWATEQRSLLQALDQFSLLCCNNSRQTADNLSLKTLEKTHQTVSKQHPIMQSKLYDFQKSIQNAICPFTLDEITQSIVKNCGLKNNNGSLIGPVIKHDYLVNTKISSPSECASMIANFIWPKQKEAA